VRALAEIDNWPVPSAAAGVVAEGGATAIRGDGRQVFELASVTKVLVALAALVAVEEGSLDLTQPAGPVGSTVRHLLAHASGLAPDSDDVLAPPATRRIYSNRGFELLADVIERATSVTIAAYLHEAVVAPLGMTATRLEGSPGSGAVSTVDDLVVVLRELLTPTLIADSTLHEATSVAFPGLTGVLPGYGKQSSNDWGLGFEVRDEKSPHWTGTTNAPTTFGHFGRSGTMMWIDPDAGVGLVCLSDRAFGPWAVDAWPRLSDAVLDEAGGGSMPP
jgi:CubicO group peptidase (beta-lactamase class C family)